MERSIKEENDSKLGFDKQNKTELNSRKDISLKELVKKEKISELECLIMITEVMRRMKFSCKYEKEKHLYSELNSTNVYVTRFFDIMINFKNPVKDLNYYSPEYFNYFYFSEVENDYIQRNKIIVWSLGLMMNLILSGEEPWSRHNGKSSSIIELLRFSRPEIPYLNVPSFEISKAIKNVELKIMLKSCLEHNQVKRLSFAKIDEILNVYLTTLLVRDLNFDFFKHKRQKADLLLLKKIFQFMICRLYDKHDKLKSTKNPNLKIVKDYEIRKKIKDENKIQNLKCFQFDKRMTMIYFTKYYFKIIRVSGETVLKYDNFFLDFGMSINSFNVIDGIYNMRPRIIIGFKNGELVKINSIYATRLDHFHLLRKKNVSIDFFPDFNSEKIINQNEEYLIIWDLNKNSILQSKETKESHNLIFLPSKDRNKNFKSLVFSKGGMIQSRDIHFGKNNWKITEGKKIKTVYDLKYDLLKDSVEITFMRKLDEFYSTHNDRILLGFSNGWIALYQFYNSRCIFKVNAHRKKINDIIHLKEYNINYFASCSDSYTVKIWNFDTEELVSELKGHVKKITSLEYLKFVNNQTIASFSNDGFTYVWDFITREKLLSLKHDNIPIKFHLYLHDFNPSSIVTITKENVIYIWQQPRIKDLDTQKSFKEAFFFGKVNENIINLKNTFYEKLNYTQTVLNKKTKYDKFDEEITNVINNNKPEKKDIDKRELSKLIKTYIGETDHKIEVETRYADWKALADKQENDILNQKKYVNLVNYIMQLNNVRNSKSIFLNFVQKIREKETAMQPKITLAEVFRSKMRAGDRISTDLKGIYETENIKNELSKEKENFLKTLYLLDNIKIIPFIYPNYPEKGKNNSCNQITNIKNFCFYFEHNEISTIERIHYFIEVVTVLEKMFYSSKSFLRVKKDNMFINTKTQRIKLLTMYSHYNMHYDWRVYYRGIGDIKEKESYLKTFFKFLKKYCFDDDILQIKMNEQGFCVDSLLEPSKLLWKNKHIFIFNLAKNYLKQFFDVHKLNIFRDKKMKNPKLIRIMNRVRDMIIYFYCKSFRYNSNESFLQRPVPQIVDLKYLTIQENKFDKVKCLVNISHLNLIAIGGKKPFLHFYDYFGVCRKIIDETDKSFINETIKCLLYLKDINYLCAGSNKGKIYIYELKGFKLSKVLFGHGDNSVKSLYPMKGYKGRNDIFASCSKDKTIAVWDFQKGEKIKTFVDYSVVLRVYYSKNNNFLISTNKNRELSFWDLESKSVKPYTFHKFESVVSVLEYFKNCCEEETICVGSLLKMNNIRSEEDIDHMNTNIKLFLVRKCLISQKPAFEFTIIGNCVKVSNIFDFGKDILVTAERISGKFLFWNIKKDGDNFKELLLCYVIKCNFLYFEKKIITFFYLKNLDKLTFCVASQHALKDNNVVIFELNANEI